MGPEMADGGQAASPAKTIKLLARTIARDLRAQGYSERDVIQFASALLAEATDMVRARPTPATLA